METPFPMRIRRSIIPDIPTDYFDDALWRELTAELRKLVEWLRNEVVLDRVSLHSDSRWPCLRFVRKHWFQYDVVKLTLQKDFLNNHHRYWQVRADSYAVFSIFYYKNYGGRLLLDRIENDDLLTKEFKEQLVEIVRKHLADS